MMSIIFERRLHLTVKDMYIHRIKNTHTRTLTKYMYVQIHNNNNNNNINTKYAHE